MADIQSVAAKIRRGKKKEERKIELECWPMPNVMVALCDGAQMAIFGDFFASWFSASRVQQVSDLHLKFALGHTMCVGMAGIHSPTAEIRRGKKKERRKKKKPQGKKIMICPIT